MLRHRTPRWLGGALVDVAGKRQLKPNRCLRIPETADAQRLRGDIQEVADTVLSFMVAIMINTLWRN